MREHHKAVVEKLTEIFRDDSSCLALAIAGSVAKGLDVESSDVDFFAVFDDPTIKTKIEKKDYFIYRKDICDYPEGYADGKAIDLPFLRDAADHGSEAIRWAFEDAIVVFSRDPEIDDLVERIPEYPEHERKDKIGSFCGQVRAYRGFFANEAVKRSDSYLMAHTATSLALFGGRLILAHNRLLYPFHKWFLNQLEQAAEKPDNLIPLMKSLLAKPSLETIHAFGDAVLNFTEWDEPPEGWVVRFFEDVEWTWRNGKPALADW